MKKIVTIVGARPQFIKAAVLSRIIVEKNEFEEIVVHTGQHFDQNMSEIFFNEMDLPIPKYNLDIHESMHGAMTGKMLEKIEKVLVLENPDAVVVYGDTNSTLAGALAANKMHIQVAHIEAGLRSFNMEMPEEVNRIITDRISNQLFCPTKQALENLKSEGFDHFGIDIVLSGDIMKDAVSYYNQKAEANSTILEQFDLDSDKFVLATIHRQENTDDPIKLKNILKGLDDISEEIKVVMPLHPRTKKRIAEFELSTKVLLIDPVGYFDMLKLLAHCKMVVTDSGGLQKESFFNKKHCIIARDETEWKELVDNGFAKIVGTDAGKMLDAYDHFLKAKSNFEMNLYGDNVGETIYFHLKNKLGLN
ncbi:non-hydrolyzing UDP-N-acetylglucosamine 2-epimerase [Namhaeicola litoreus]|uniref:Non-hydrolyzing UDP-N-acetylglucosamine 2-epimerase n=1 Tax=Namhaeicola litoreus TaxID=1052145 RepID=A0ABW3Y181_9FLAO